MNPRESAAAPVRARVTPSTSAGPLSMRPNKTRAMYPEAAPMKCPMIVFLGDAAGARGV